LAQIHTVTLLVQCQSVDTAQLPTTHDPENDTRIFRTLVAWTNQS
jgi:hypothetical protein